MTQIRSIGAGMYSDLAVAAPATPLSPTALAQLKTSADFFALFATEIQSNGGSPAAGAFVRLKNVREYPALGTPPNVVNVPTFGQATSQQIQGQSDAPSMEIQLNFVPAEWAKEVGNILGNAVGDGITRVFRFSLLNSRPTGTDVTQFASSPAGLGAVENSQYFWYGKIDALQVTPQLTDANTATLTLTMQSEFFGAFTSNPTP